MARNRSVIWNYIHDPAKRHPRLAEVKHVRRSDGRCLVEALLMPPEIPVPVQRAVLALDGSRGALGEYGALDPLTGATGSRMTGVVHQLGKYLASLFEGRDCALAYWGTGD